MARAPGKPHRECISLVKLKKMLPDHEAARRWFEYDRGQAHTIGIESFSSMLKRGYQDTCHHWSHKWSGNAYVFPAPSNAARPLSRHLPLWLKVRRVVGIGPGRAAPRPQTHHGQSRRHDSHAVMNEVPVPAISRLLGHSSTRMTPRYTHLGDRGIEAAAERIGHVVAELMGM